MAMRRGGGVETSQAGVSAADHDAAEAHRIAECFVHARRAACALSRFPGVIPATLERAYRCQALAIAQWPDGVAGWKVARIPPDFRAQYPEERLVGPVFAANVRVPAPGAAAVCPVFAGGFAAVESELVIRLAADAPADKTAWSIAEAANLVASVHVGVEVASSPLATLNDLGSGAVISDFGNNWGVVVGPAIEHWGRVETIAARTYVDDQLVGDGAATMQDALDALAFALAKCAAQGRPLRADDVISTGMITGVHEVRVGQRSRHVFEGCADLYCHIVAEGAHS